MKAKGQEISELSLEEMDVYWNDKNLGALLRRNKPKENKKLGIHTAIIGDKSPLVAKVETCINNMYAKLISSPAPRCKPTPQLFSRPLPQQLK